MSSPRLLPALAVVGALASLAAPAWAADVTPADATALEAQLRGWMASLVAPAVDVGPRPVQVTAAGDHFDVVLPAPDLLSVSGIVPNGTAVTMKAKPLDGGRYALDDLKIPSPLKLTAPPGMPPDSKGPPKTMTLSFDSQEFHGLLDPSYATTSSFDSVTTGMRIVSDTSSSVTARGVSHSTWQPTGDGKINILAESTSEKSASTIEPEPGKKVTYSIDKATTSAHAAAVSPASLGALMRSVAALVPTLPGTKGSLNPEQRTLARTAVFALRDMFAGADTTQKLENIKISADGHSGSIAKVGLSTKMGVEDGKLLLATNVSLDGIDSPEIPKGVYRDYLPRHVSISPRVSGIPSEDLVKLMLRAIDSTDQDMAELQEAAIALLGAGPLEVGIDELALDLGRASLAGTGTLDVASPTDITGEAEISVQGLDTLIKTANTTPELKQMAPVLIFLKGIGKQDGEKTVWNINYEDNKVTVNDTDLSDLIPKSGPAPGAATPGGSKKKQP